MKRLKTLLALLLAVLLFAGLCLPAAADDAAPAEEDPTAETASSEDGGASIVDQDWDTIIRDLLAEHYLYDTQVAVGYLNLVTGEEHYLNPDEYMTAASMFKLPLCMYYTELLKTGRTTWDEEKEGESYKSVQDNILLYSDNKAAERLWEKLGGYAEFRRLTAPYMGADPEEIKGVNEQYNRYTARQFITCLKLLYDENERFPDIIETMKQAMPDRYFRLQENRFPIAHKFGFIPSTMSNEESALNDCGIVFTSQPFALVCFTRNGGAAEQFLTSCCSVMCDYTEASAALTAAQEAEEKARAEAEAAASATPEPEASEAPADEASRAGSELLARLSSRLSPVLSRLPKDLPVIPLGFVVLFMLLGLIAVLRLTFRYRARFFPLLFALLVSAAAMLLSITGIYSGTVYAKPSGDPAETVVLFFDNLCAGRYDAACEQLRDYADLGLGDTPSTAAGRMVYDALHASYSYELVGEPEVKMLDAVQKVRFRYLALPSIGDDVAAQTQRQIEAIVEQSNPNEVYDADRHYLPEVTERAYLAALDAVLAHAEKYYTEDELTLSLTYTYGRWQMLMSPELLRALGGGTGV